MFSQKCPRCNRKISKDFDFCPYCGNNLQTEREMKKGRDFGLLGRNDDLNDFPDLGPRFPFGFNKLFNSLLREVDKQFKQMDKEIGDEKEEFKKIRINPTSGISIKISTGTGKQPEIKVKSFGPEFKGMEKQIKEKKIENLFDDEQVKKIYKLPKKEAETKVRRLSNKIVYELILPGVKNLKNVLINKLENSIEVKAFSKDTAYFKLIPLNLPILNYKLEKEKLILELKP